MDASKWRQWGHRGRQVSIIKESLGRSVQCELCFEIFKGGISMICAEPVNNEWEKHREYFCMDCVLALPSDSGLKQQFIYALQR